MFKFKDIIEKKSNEFITKIDKSQPFCTYTINSKCATKIGEIIYKKLYFSIQL